MNHEKEGRKKYLVLSIVLVGVFMSVLDAVALNIALPAITSYFNVAVADTQWVVTGYLLTQTCFLIISGKIAERVGQARMFNIGLIVFSVSSLLCALSSTLPQLIAFRVVQGLGGSMLFSVSTAIVFRTFGPTERGKAMGFLGSTVAVGGMLGPVIGGLLVGTMGWRSIFLVNVPIGLIAAAVAVRALKVDEVLADRLHLDLPGSVLWIVTIASLVLTLGMLADTGSLTPATGTYLIVFAIAAALFVLWERRAKEPLLDLSVFKVGRFDLVGLSMAVFFISLNMVTILGPFYYEGVLDYDPETVGFIFMVLPTIMMVGSPLVGRMYDRVRFRPYATAGHLVRAASLLLLALGFMTINVPLTLAAFLCMGLGSSLFQTPNNTEFMLALPREKSGLASSIQATTRNLSMAIGVSLATLLMTLTMGSMDYSAIAGGPQAGELASSVAFAIVIGAALSVVGAILSRLSERACRRDKGTDRGTVGHDETK
ncbi:MAG: MFS transporter [Methanomassiliicoccus sp.]|nr:MFS transporter [Methanomassiliicoccus sp.]